MKERKAVKIDLFAEAETVRGFDCKGEFSYFLKPSAAFAGEISALYPSAAGCGFFAFGGGTLSAVKDGVSRACAAFSAPPRRAKGTYKGKTCDLFFGDGKMYADDGAAGETVNGVAGGAVEDEFLRMQVKFDGEKICLSAPFEPTEYSVSEGGAEFVPYGGAGEILGVKQAGGKLFAVGERGAWRCSYAGDDTETDLAFLPFPTEGIVKESLQSCGEEMIFLTRAGRLCSFGGQAVKELVREVKINGVLSSSFADGIYLLAAGKTLFLYDTETNGYAFCDAGAEISALGGRMLYAGGLFRLERKKGGGTVITRPLDLAEPAPKKICRVRFAGTGSASLSLSSEREEKTFPLRSGEEVFPKMSGRKFVFALSCGEGCRIEEFEAVYTPTGVK